MRMAASSRRGRFHTEFVTAEAFGELDEESQMSLKGLVEQQAEKAQSSLAAAMLADWPTRSAKMLRLSPKPPGLAVCQVIRSEDAWAGQGGRPMRRSAQRLAVARLRLFQVDV